MGSLQYFAGMNPGNIRKIRINGIPLIGVYTDGLS